MDPDADRDPTPEADRDRTDEPAGGPTDAAAGGPPPEPDGSLPEPDDPDRESAYALLHRGQELMHRGHNAQAAIVLERAALAEPGKGSILEALGRAFYNSGQHDRARQTFEALLELDPSADYAHYALGQSLKLLRRRAEARTHLKLAVALNPRSELYRAALDRLERAPG
jgi:tetratricopeptide (TPR) repeat protein